VTDERKDRKNSFRIIRYCCGLNITKKSNNPLGHLSRMNPKVITTKRQLKIHAIEHQIQKNYDTYISHEHKEEYIPHRCI